MNGGIKPEIVRMPSQRRIALWIKILYTAFVVVLVPAYTVIHGLANFLWFSNIAMLTTVVILWRESSFLASTICVLVLLPELGWNIGFFGRLIFGLDIFGLTGYMFDPEVPLFVRGLSLYHVALPPLLVWLVFRLGYDRRAFKSATLLAWVVLPVTFMFASPERNINWVYGFQEEAHTWIPAPLHLVLLMALFPPVIYWPTHRLLMKLFSAPGPQRLP
jgi:hypothetical protein